MEMKYLGSFKLPFQQLFLKELRKPIFVCVFVLKITPVIPCATNVNVRLSSPQVWAYALGLVAGLWPCLTPAGCPALSVVLKVSARGAASRPPRVSWEGGCGLWSRLAFGGPAQAYHREIRRLSVQAGRKLG